jgi:hypothetical protein
MMPTRGLPARLEDATSGCRCCQQWLVMLPCVSGVAATGVEDATGVVDIAARGWIVELRCYSFRLMVLSMVVCEVSQQSCKRYRRCCK